MVFEGIPQNKENMLSKGICLFVFFVFCTGLMAEGQTLTAKEIIKKADDKNRGLTSQGEMTMTIVRPTWTRSVTMKSWQKGSKYAMILITQKWIIC